MAPLVSSLAWVLGACALGLATSAIFSGRLRLARRTYLVPYMALAGAYLYGFVRWQALDVRAILAHNWVWGLLAGALVSALLIRNITSQPASARSTGSLLLFDEAWVGLSYGAMDALLLNILPVLAVWQGLADATWTAGLAGKIGAGVLALLASLLVTLLYHLGYAEFRNRTVLLVLAGNAVITLAYLISGNPLGALTSHAIMHMAGVLRGPETMLQLPPHYAPSRGTT